jgi:hypothetical protein
MSCPLEAASAYDVEEPSWTGTERLEWRGLRFTKPAVVSEQRYPEEEREQVNGRALEEERGGSG